VAAAEPVTLCSETEGGRPPSTIIRQDEGQRALDERLGCPAISNLLSAIRDTAAFAEPNDDFMSPIDLFMSRLDHST
jgi:hypothetical protein